MNDLTTQRLIIGNALLHDETSLNGRLFVIDKNNVKVKLFMHAVVHGNAPDYMCKLITMTEHEGVIYIILGIGKI